MMSANSFLELVAALVDRGYAKDKAEDYASRLGDTIEEDADGKWVIRDDQDAVIDRIDPLE